MNEALRNAPIGVLEIGRENKIIAANSAITDLLQVDQNELTGQPVAEILPRAATGAFRTAFTGEFPVDCSIEEYCPAIERWLAVETTDMNDGAIVYIRDTTESHTDDQRITRLEQRLDRLQRIESLVTTVLGRIIDVSDPEEVWDTICQRLGTADLYEFVWIGDWGVTRERLRVATAAGDASTLQDALATGAGPNSAVPERLAVERGTTQTADPIAEKDSISREIRVAAFGRGLQSSLGIPIKYGDTVYGVIGVYTARKEGFNEQEVASLETLGTIAGFAVNAIRQEDLLFADTVTELTLTISNTQHPFVQAAAVADESFSLDGAVPQTEDTAVCYLRGHDATDKAVTTLENHVDVASVRVVEEGTTKILLELIISGATPATTVTDWGAAITDATYTADGAELVAELPSGCDVRDVVETIDEQFGQTEIRATKRKPRDPTTVEAFTDELSERLTEKQYQVLRTAYLSDYFTSPRGSTSAEVAEALDITGPTVLYHLRNAQQKILDTFFEDPPTRTPNQQHQS